MHDSCVVAAHAGGAVSRLWQVPGSASALFVDGDAQLLHPEDQVFEAMLAGWRDQQLARNLNSSTIHNRDADPRYLWTQVCQELFGTHPSQICFEWNSAAHTCDSEGRPQRRALTKTELQRLFDFADDRVEQARRRGSKAWLSLMRDAAAFKVAYAWGLRRREVAMLDLEDFGTNPHAPEFSDRGVLYVRWGKATKGSPPRRRSVLTVFAWSVAVLDEWLDDFRPLFESAATGSAVWPSERSARLGTRPLGDRFTELRDEAGLPEELGMHCLRHSYVTHLEAGFDPLFVQQQVGHSYASTTA